MTITIILHEDEQGFRTVYATGPVHVLSIDERQPRDRVYQMSLERGGFEIISEARVLELIGDSRIGRFGDMPGKENAIAEALGFPKPHPDMPSGPKLVE